MASNVTLYASANDKALSWFSRGAALGETRAGDVPKGGPVIVPGIETIDVSKASTDFFQLNHSAFGDRPHLLMDMKMIFETGKHPPDKRFGVYEPVTHGGKTYWRYEK